MSLYNFMEDMIPRQQSPFSLATEISIPTPNDNDLRNMYQQQRMMRWGIVAAIMRRSEAGTSQVLLMRHAGSDKTPHGSWGALGETSRIRTDPSSGAREVEPTTATLLRGISEEIGLHVAASDLQASVHRPYLDTTWPVGKNYPGQVGGARSPMVFVSAGLAEQITQAGPSTEILGGRKFFEIGEAMALAQRAARAESTELVRYGLQDWLHVTQATLSDIHNDQLAPLASEPWLHSVADTHDALLHSFYDK